MVLVSQYERATRLIEELESHAEVKCEVELGRRGCGYLAIKVQEPQAAANQRLNASMSQIELEAERVRAGAKGRTCRILQHRLADNVIARRLKLHREWNNIACISERKRATTSKDPGELEIQ
jgi:hypothetical protein